MPATAAPKPATQAARRERTRKALLESAALGISRYGYENLVLDHVAGRVGYSRGAVYHLFEDKQALAVAAVAEMAEEWEREVGSAADREADPVQALVALARGHAAFCRREEARMVMTLRVEFGDRDHPVGRAAKRADEILIERCARLIAAGRMRKSIPSGPPARTLARAAVGATEGALVQLGGKAHVDELVAERVLRGVLGLRNSR